MIEGDAGAAIASCVKNPKYLDLSDKYFVLLGAGSGPWSSRSLLLLANRSLLLFELSVSDGPPSSSPLFGSEHYCR